MADGASAGKVNERILTADRTACGENTRTAHHGRHAGLPGLRSLVTASVIAVFSFTAFTSNAAQAASACPKPPELAAVKTRVLQTELMVAALSCGAQKNYNAFARKFYNELNSNGRILRTYFRRGHAKNGDRYLDRFVTNLANEASKRSISHGPAYCADARALFQKVLQSESSGLIQVTQDLSPDVAGSLPPCTDRLVRR